MRNGECGMSGWASCRARPSTSIPHSALRIPHSRGSMALLEFVRGPEDIRRLERDQLQLLADEVRRRLIDVVSQTGGHIGAGLGVVALTVALGYCFASTPDKMVWDVGHQEIGRASCRESGETRVC